MCKRGQSNIFLLVFIGILCADSTISAQNRRLNDYTQAALKTSPILKDYYGQMEQNKIDSSIISTNYKPQIDAVGQAIYSPNYGNYGYDEAISNGGTYEAVVRVSQNIAPHKELTLNKQLSNTQYQSLSVQAKQAEYQLNKDVTEKYLAICLLQQQQVYFKQSDSLLAKELNILKSLTEKGIYKVSDYYELLVEEQSEHTERVELSLQIAESFSALNEVCGITDTTSYKLQIPQIERYIQNDYRQLVTFQKFQADSLQLIFQNQLVDVQYAPHLSYYADAGKEVSQPGFSNNTVGNSIGLNLIIPIYDGHKRDLKHKELKISDDIRTNYEDFYKQTYTTKTTFLAKQMEDANRLILQLKTEEEQVSKWRKVNEAQLSAGNISVTEILLSIRKELEVKNNVSKAQINQLLLQNEYNYWNR